MSQTLYRKYRPQNFSEVIGQKHIVQTLSNAIKNERIGQAYLFTGPRGTGKTSIARIFAKTINCGHLKNSNPCEKCEACRLIGEGKSLDIIEVDAASNTGVDNIRELRETVKLQPTSLKYKVYIIDEVHMLSMGAFNALLKTLEEPPLHVIFILATTEIHKVPETIISRCQRFDFARLPIENIIEKLELIAKNEKIKIERGALEMIALSAEGGMRDAESLLGQIISLEDKNITLKEVEEILGATDQKFAGKILNDLIEKNSHAAIQKINIALTDGYDLEILTKSLVNYLRQLMLLKISSDLKSIFTYEMSKEQLESMLVQTKKIELAEIIQAINLFLEAQGKISSSILPQLPLEIAVIKATHVLPAPLQNYNEQATQNYNPPAGGPIPKKSPAIISQENPASNKKINNDVAIENFDNESELGRLTTAGVQTKWKQLLTDIAPYNHSLKALLSNCQLFAVNNKEIVLATPYDFYKDKLNIPTNRSLVEEVFGKILETKIRIKVVLCKEVGIEPKIPESEILNAKETSAPTGEQNSLLSSALEIMGGKVVKG